MDIGTHQIIDGKVILRIRDRICDTPESLLSSPLFLDILKRTVAELERRNSPMLGIFPQTPVRSADLLLLVRTLKFLVKLPGGLVPKVVEGAETFFRDPVLFNDFVEHLYNSWRGMQRLVICDSAGDRFDQRPYRTFNSTVETLTHLVRSTYRETQENITGNHPNIYRQVSAGAEIATIALPKDIHYPELYASRLNAIPVIRQVLIYPPLIFNPPMNKRSGVFERVTRNPLEALTLNKNDWLCYPARVGPLLVMVYFSLRHFELGFTLANLFELAGDEALHQKPDAVFLFGVPEEDFPNLGAGQTIFYDDQAHDLLVAAIPDSPKFGYFGYLKKMILTLHNIKMIKLGKMPFHGALINLAVRGHGRFTVLTLGDTGAGKSEMLEALRTLGSGDLEDITIIADDMGSLGVDGQGRVLGYGTETGAFVRLDDLKPGYAFGQIDRTIIMSPAEVNARAVLPVTTYETIMRGFGVDMVLYANNYEAVDAQHAAVERFESPEQALAVFREGAVMSKGTTTTTGLVHSYFANVFGPQQYPEAYDALAKTFFEAFFAQGMFVGQMRTQLGIAGMERNGPEQAAQALLRILKGEAG